MDNYTFRLKPGDDLLDSIRTFVLDKQVEAGCVLSGVGSLRRAVMRFSKNWYTNVSCSRTTADTRSWSFIKRGEVQGPGSIRSGWIVSVSGGE